jgi:hypothetical protein
MEEGNVEGSLMKPALSEVGQVIGQSPAMKSKSSAQKWFFAIFSGGYLLLWRDSSSDVEDKSGAIEPNVAQPKETLRPEAALKPALRSLGG